MFTKQALHPEHPEHPEHRQRAGHLGRQHGISFIELILFIMIVGIALGAVLSTMNLTTRTSADPLRRKQALMIAEGLMEEVQLARFTYCDGNDVKVTTATSVSDCTVIETVGASGGEKRPYNHINDYVTQFSQAQRAFDVNGVLADVSGTAIDPAGYIATLSLTPEALGGVASDASPGGNNVLRITVTVTGAGGEPIVLDGYRMRYAPNSP